MKLVAINKRDQNEAWLDPWSVVHGATGLAFGLTGIGFWATLATAIAWDILEQMLERSEAGQKFFRTSGPESWGNVLSDTALFLGGWWLGQKYNSTGPATNPYRPKSRRRRNPKPRAAVVVAPMSSPVFGPRGQRQRVGAPVSQRNAVAGAFEA